MCPEGPCHSEIVVHADGSIQEKPHTVQVGNLKKAIAATDFAELQRAKFMGTCPTAYDGQRYTFTFFGGIGGDQVLDSCVHDLSQNHVLLNELWAVRDAAAKR